MLEMQTSGWKYLMFSSRWWSIGLLAKHHLKKANATELETPWVAWNTETLILYIYLSIYG